MKRLLYWLTERLWPIFVPVPLHEYMLRQSVETWRRALPELQQLMAELVKIGNLDDAEWAEIAERWQP